MVDGETVKFPSKREARRFDELYLQYKGGAIQDLRLQQDFTLVEGYTRPNGKRVRPMVYKADFVYLRNGKRIVEDAKGKTNRKVSHETQTHVGKVRNRNFGGVISMFENGKFPTIEELLERGEHLIQKAVDGKD